MDPALGWSDTLSVQVGGAGTVAAAGVVAPRLLAGRLGLCTDLAAVMARSGFVPLRHRGRALVDAACSLAAGATCLSDIEAMTAQEEIFGPGGGASDTTMLRVLDELAARLRADGLPGRRLARATASARAKAWAGVVARHGQLPAVTVAGTDLTRPASASGARPRPVLVVRLDATLLDVASAKDQAAGTYKQGFGFHPLTAWATTIGEGLAVMLRPGNAGSFTACDHIAVLGAAFTQIPAPWRTDVLVTIDGASHDIIDHLTAMNTAVAHGKRGPRVEYSIGWPVDEGDPRRDRGAARGPLGRRARHRRCRRPRRAGRRPDRDPARARPRPRPAVHLAGRPAGHRPPRPPTGRQAGQARRRRRRGVRRVRHQHRHRAGPVARRPSPHPGPRRGPGQAVQGVRRPQPALDKLRPQRRLAATGRPGDLADRVLRHLALDDDLAKASTKTLRFRLLSAPARLVTHARRKILKIPPGWAWAQDLATAWDRLHALHPD